MKRKLILAAAIVCTLSVTASAYAERVPLRQTTWTLSKGGSTPSTTTSTGGSTQVPEPGMLGLFGLGLIGLGYARRRRTRG